VSDPREEFQTYGDVATESLRGRPLPDIVEAAELWPDDVKLVPPEVVPQVVAQSANGPAPSLASKLKDLGTELSRGVPTAEWVGHRGLTARAAITFLSGYIGAGKTPLTLGMIGAALKGESFCGFPHAALPEGYRIAYLTQETEATFLPSVAAAGISEALATGRMEVGYLHDFAVDEWPKVIEDVAGSLRGNGLLVVDTVLDWSQARDENDSAEMTKALRPLVRAVGTGVSAWATGHTVKTFDDTRDDDVGIQSVRGSGAVIANASIVLLYKRPKPKQGETVRYLSMVRSRLAYDQPSTRYVEKDAIGMREASWIEMKMTGIERSRLDLLKLVDEAGDGGIKKADLRDASHMDFSEFATAITGLVVDGKVTESGEGKKGNPVVIKRV
jgi:AAA domain-containing protein